MNFSQLTSAKSLKLILKVHKLCLVCERELLFKKIGDWIKIRRGGHFLKEFEQGALPEDYRTRFLEFFFVRLR